MPPQCRNPRFLTTLRAAGLLAAFALAAGGTLRAAPQNPVATVTPRPVFKEIWAYLLRGEEKELTGAEPVTDLCYFGASLNHEGRITETISRPSITQKDGRKPAIHLVVAELSNESLMHFSLDPEYGVRPLLIQDICRVAAPFDGIQIDFESVARDDAEYFFGFLKDLKAALPAGKTLSVAVPARTQVISDAYDYSRITSVADRIVIMAYDEHWSSSSPGPVASLPWCAKVVDFAETTIAADKIVMGLPLYGRAWQDKRLARALRFKNVQDIVAETGSKTSYDADLGAWFEYSQNVVVKVFYDDARTIMDKLQLYRSKNVNSVSFWRIGLGPSELWTSIAFAGSPPAAAEPAAGAPAPVAGAVGAPAPAASAPAPAAPAPVPSPTAAAPAPVAAPAAATVVPAPAPAAGAPAAATGAAAPSGAITLPLTDAGLADPLPAQNQASQNQSGP